MYSRASLALRVALSLLLTAWLPPAALAADPKLPARASIHTGHSAMWYSPAREGEGWVLEILPDNEAALHWHTFDDTGNPRWLTGTGRIHRGRKGDELHFERLIATHGPRFGPAYDPADAVREHVGRATLRFNGCDSGEILFDAYGRQGRFSLARRSLPMAAAGDCRPTHGTPGEPAQPYIGPAASWHDPAYEGQSLSLAWTPSGDAHVAWFTFDTQGNPYWLTGTGTQQGGRIVFPALHAVRGGRFADPFDSDDVTRTPWGRLELTLACTTGQATYAPTAAGFAAGQFDLRRPTALSTPGCAPITPGHSGLWDSPAREGEGWLLEILPDDTAAIYGFGFDAVDKPRWFTGTGRIHRSAKGEEIRFEHLIATHGPRFGELGNATHQAIGHATLRFHDCAGGEIAFTTWGQQGSYPLNRHTRTMAAAGCRPIHGTPGEPIQPYAGQSGTWHSPARAGQSLSLTWSATGEAKLLWLTFDAQGEPYWLTGTGRQEGERIVFPALYLPERDRRMADVFSTAKAIPTDDETVHIVDEPIRVPSVWGGLELAMGCSAGEVSYSPTAEGFAAGGFVLQRQTQVKSLACPWVRPKLTDLYDIALIELPTEPATLPPSQHTPGSENLIFPHTVSDTGVVAGRRKLFRVFPDGYTYDYKLARISPEGTSWATPSNSRIWDAVIVSPEGDRIVTGVEAGVGGGAGSYVRTLPTLFAGATQTPLPNLIYDTTHRIIGASHDFSRVVGAGMRRDGDTEWWMETPWIWDAESGQIELPFSDSLGEDLGVLPVTAANNGRIVIGLQGCIREFPGAPSHIDFFCDYAVSWIDQQIPSRLHGTNGEYLGHPVACDSNCEIVFGNNTWARMDEYRILREQSFHAWYWKSNGESGSLGALNPTEDNPKGWRYYLRAVSSEGGLVVGIHISPEMYGSLPNGSDSSGGFIWSQSTGFVSVSEVLEELGYTVSWPTMGAIDISPSGNYILLTTGEVFSASVRGAPSFSHSALLRLTPKQ